MTLKEAIESKLKYLPEKDIKIAKKLLAENNFEVLKEIVDSAIFKVKKYKSNPNYENINLNELIELQIEVNSYIRKFGLFYDMMDYDS